MIACAFVAIIFANTQYSGIYTGFVNSKLGFTWGEFSIHESVREWIKDLLMVFFFLLISMELKREIKVGVLSEKGQILLPMFSAIGGMAIPAVIFYLINLSTPQNINGWAIPTATDIAFALAIVNIFGKSLPAAVKILLLAIAIFDDFGAIVIIAVFYNHDLSLLPLILAAIGMIGLFALNKSKINSLVPYCLIGIYLWFCFFNAGIHTTLAGVALGFAIPMNDYKNKNRSPLESMIKFLHPWVNFLILPLFAFSSAGVELAGFSNIINNNLSLSIAIALFIGKQIGIFGAIFVSVKSGLLKMPEAANWLHIYAISILAGIGFTMSFFIGMLAFQDPQSQDMIRIGVLGGSFLSAVFGAIILKYSCIAKRK